MEKIKLEDIRIDSGYLADKLENGKPCQEHRVDAKTQRKKLDERTPKRRIDKMINEENVKAGSKYDERVEKHVQKAFLELNKKVDGVVQRLVKLEEEVGE